MAHGTQTYNYKPLML